MSPPEGQHTSFRGFESDSSSSSGVEIESDGGDEIHEMRTAGYGSRKKTRREIIHDMLEMLEGSEVNRSLAVVGFACACCAELFGIFDPLEHIEAYYRSFTFLAALFLVNQFFFFIKNIRDEDIIPFGQHKQTGISTAAGHVYTPLVHILHARMYKPHHAPKGAPAAKKTGCCPKLHCALCAKGSMHVTEITNICLILSIIATTVGIFSMDAKHHTMMFIGLATLYMMSASLNFAMTIRDKFEYSVWESEINGRHITSNKALWAMSNVIVVVSGHHKTMCGIFLLVGLSSIGITIGAMINFGLKEKGIGLLSAAMFMTIASATNLARVMNMTKEEAAKAHHNHSSELSVVGSFVIAITLTVLGLVLIEIELYKRIVLGLGILVMLDSIFNASKVMYRDRAIRKIKMRIWHKFHPQAYRDTLFFEGDYDFWKEMMDKEEKERLHNKAREVQAHAHH